MAKQCFTKEQYKMKYLFITLAFMLIISGCTEDKGLDMFSEKIEKLINSKNEDDEELALGDLLSSVKNTNINYGYRVFNISKNKRVMPEDLNNELDDELLVTIFVGDKQPYTEYKWKPNYNGHITRLIMP